MSGATPVPQPASWDVASFPVRVLLIRHGQSASFIPGSEASLDPPLSDQGRQQAIALAERLAGFRLDAVYASALARAVDTARPLAESRGLSVIQRSDLNEVTLGHWENGEFRRRAAARDPEFMEFVAAGRWDLIPGGEGDANLRGRVRRALEAIVAEHDSGTIAVVCHSGVINAWLADHFGAHPSIVAVIDNTSITAARARVERDGSSTYSVRWLIEAVNDCQHLGDPYRGGGLAAAQSARTPHEPA